MTGVLDDCFEGYYSEKMLESQVWSVDSSMLMVFSVLTVLLEKKKTSNYCEVLTCGTFILGWPIDSRGVGSEALSKAKWVPDRFWFGIISTQLTKALFSQDN